MTEFSSVTGKVILLMTFAVGFVVGFKTKEWRIKFTEWRRDRHAKKLVEAQKKLEELTGSAKITVS